MTPICAEHAALLRAVARNTNDAGARRAYADWLQERQNPGWIVLTNYPPKLWSLVDRREHDTKWGRRYQTLWRVCWLDGGVFVPSTTHHITRIKSILNAYADGKAVHERAS